MLRRELLNIKQYSTNEPLYEIKLDANESAADVPLAVKNEITGAMERLAFNRYPDTAVRNLSKKIADQLGLSPGNIILGNGSSELLAKVCWVYGGNERGIMFPYPSFSMYPIYVQLAGSKALPIELEEDFLLSKRKILEAYNEYQPSLLILCCPNNPTGIVMSPEDIKDIIETVTCPVIVDEAYYEFYGQTALDFFKENKNLIIMRTFSKAYGLAGLRVGYMIAHPEVNDIVSTAMMPYHMNALSLCAAEVVYGKQELLHTNIMAVTEERERMFASFSALPGLTVYPSKANFLLIKIPRHAARLAKHLCERGIAVRSFSAGRLCDCLRITIGSRTENDVLIDEMNKYVANGGGK